MEFPRYFGNPVIAPPFPLTTARADADYVSA